MGNNSDLPANTPVSQPPPTGAEVAADTATHSAPPKPRRWRRWGLMALVLITLGTARVGWQVSHTPGGFEEWLGDTISDLRSRFPVLVVPINEFQEWAHEEGYAWSQRLQRWRGAG